MDSGDSNVTVVLVYHCWICTSEFFDKLSIIKHLKAEHGDRQELKGVEKKMKVPICLECGSTNPCEHRVKDEDLLEDEYEDDIIDEDNNDGRACLLTCVTCGESFPNPVSLRQHRQMAHPDDKSYQCTFCNSTFVKQSHLVVHTRIHTGSRPYVCAVCGNRFPKSSDLKRHSRVHSGEKPFTCALCSQCFTQKCSLEKHAKIHGKRIGGHPCLMCGLVFFEVESLNEHTRLTHREVSWQCKTCLKMFAEERHLLLHEKSHLAVKAFTCSFCPRNFSTRTLLLKHEECIHASKKEIRCDDCGKEFKRRENLARHMLSHSGVKNHKCAVCGMAFTEKGSLTRHTKSQHDMLRPHVCIICARAFTRKILLRKHMDRVHSKTNGGAKIGEVVYYRCKICQKLLKKPGITQHMKHHKLGPDAWEDNVIKIESENTKEDVGIKHEGTYCEEIVCKEEIESDGEKVNEKVNQWDSDSTVENSDTETESGNRYSQYIDNSSGWNNLSRAENIRDGGRDLESEAIRRIVEGVYQNSMASFVEDSHKETENIEENYQNCIENPVLKNFERLMHAAQINAQNVSYDGGITSMGNSDSDMLAVGNMYLDERVFRAENVDGTGLERRNVIKETVHREDTDFIG